jgi:hypothetical protein
VHDTNAITIGPDAVRAWLCQPSDEHPEFTDAEGLGVDEKLTGPGEEDFLPTVRRVLAAEPAGVRRRADVTRVELWLIPDGEILHQGAVITVDLANGIRLASLHQDVKDFADRDQRGVAAILAALDHIAAQVCLLVDRYQATRPGAPVPADGHTTAPGGWACSILIGEGITEKTPGTQEIQVVVADAEAARKQLLEAGVDASGVDAQPWGNFVYFRDPDGNRWSLQAIESRPNG